MIPAKLQFPANVYASALALAYGRAEFTGFGVADDLRQSVDVPAMQRTLAAQLVARLPSAPASVLEVGCGLGTLALELAIAGYQVHAISADAVEIDHLQEKARAQGLVIAADAVRFEQFKAGHSFDAIVLHSSAHYIDPLKLLAKARQQLKPGGRLLLADQFIQRSEQHRETPVPLLQSFLQLAARLGYQLQERLHLDAHHAITCFLPALAQHCQALSEICDVDPDQVEQLRQALEEESRQFAAGERSLVLLHLTTPLEVAHPDEVFGTIDDFGSADIAQLFERSFGVPFDPAVWHWKYGEGRGRAVCIRQDGDIVAHYGGAPRDILYFGQSSKAIQICDVMVLPERRSFYSREGLFFRSAASFLELQVGYSAPHLLGIGFPNIKAMHIAARLGLYEKTDDFIEVVYPPLDEEMLLASSSLVAQPFDLNAASLAEADRLWKEMHSDFRQAIIGLRDGGYLEYRYQQHPRDYEFLQIRDNAQQLRGILVTKRHGEEILLMDVVAARPLLIDSILCTQRYLQTRAGGDPRLRCWITGAFASWVMTPGAELRDMQIEIPCNRWSPGPATAQLQGAWWLTAGDMDFM